MFRRTFVSSLAAIVLLLGSAFPSTAKAYDGWVYSAELGGWLDVNTGLVWGDHSLNVVHHGVGWDYAQGTYLTNYRALTGIAAWRMPTIAELQLAAAHDIDSAINNPVPAVYCWTSETKSKGWSKVAHYAVNLISGDTVLYNNGSNICFVAVYRAFTP